MPAEIGRVKLALLPPGTMLRLEHPPFHVLVARVGEQVFAIEDACPHSGRSLCAGSLVGTVVTCPGHAWQVDVTTGRVVKPAVSESNPCYSVTLDGQDAVIWASTV